MEAKGSWVVTQSAERKTVNWESYIQQTYPSKKERRKTLFTNDTILYIKNPKESIKKTIRTNKLV